MKTERTLIEQFRHEWHLFWIGAAAFYGVLLLGLLIGWWLS